jgi:hypothetical protein
VDAVKVRGGQDVRRSDLGAIDIPSEECRGDGQGVGNHGAASFARRWTFFQLARLFDALFGRVMRNVRNVARAERSGGVGKLGHDARPERGAGQVCERVWERGLGLRAGARARARARRFECSRTLMRACPDFVFASIPSLSRNLIKVERSNFQQRKPRFRERRVGLPEKAVLNHGGHPN